MRLLHGAGLYKLDLRGALLAGDTGLEIAPGKDVDADPELSKLGNAWNAVPNAKRWTPLDPIEGAITGAHATPLNIMLGEKHDSCIV